MTMPEPSALPAATGPRDLVPCLRLERPLPCEEHARCPYCFGRPEEIETARHELFCDWRRGRDPIHFGFPPELGRHLHG
jgi:hypothetical protein